MKTNRTPFAPPRLMRGATGVADGASGYVPKPLAAAHERLLRAAGDWTVLSVAATTGAMSGWTSGFGLTFHGGGTLTGASGALTLTPLAGQPLVGQWATRKLTIAENTVFGAGLIGVWMLPTATAPSSTNHVLATDGTTTYVNGASTLSLRTGQVSAVEIDASQNATFAGRMGFGTDGTTAAARGVGTEFQIVLGNATNYAALRALTVTTQQNAIATTSTVGLYATNETAATAGVPVQMSPRLGLHGSAWDTAATQTLDWWIENLPTSAATPTSTLKFGHSLNGAAATYPMTLTSGGSLTVLAAINAGAITSDGGLQTFGANDSAGAGFRFVRVPNI